MMLIWEYCYNRTNLKNLKFKIMKTENLNTIQRYGEPLVKYKRNVNDTKHLFCYKLNGLYYSFIMLHGLLVDQNDKEIKNGLIKGTKKTGKYFEEYKNSSLNLWSTHKIHI